MVLADVLKVSRAHEVDLEIFLVASVLAYFVYDFADELVALSGMAIQPALRQ